MSPTQWSRIAKNESAFPGETLLAVMGDAVARAQVHQRAGDRAAVPERVGLLAWRVGLAVLQDGQACGQVSAARPAGHDRRFFAASEIVSAHRAHAIEKPRPGPADQRHDLANGRHAEARFQGDFGRQTRWRRSPSMLTKNAPSDSLCTTSSRSAIGRSRRAFASASNDMVRPRQP